MKLYALALRAERPMSYGEDVEMMAAATAAMSDDEAVGRGIKIAKNHWPVGEWQNHDAVICEIPLKLMADILASQEQDQ